MPKHTRGKNYLNTNAPLFPLHALPGERVAAKVLNADASRLRVALSLKALAPDPLRETIETLVWVEPSPDAALLPQVADIVTVLRLEAGISGVAVGKQAMEQHVVAQVGRGAMWGQAGDGRQGR